MKITFDITKNGNDNNVKITLNEGINNVSHNVKNFSEPYQNILFDLLNNSRLTVNERNHCEKILKIFIGYLMWDDNDDNDNNDDTEKESNDEMITEEL